MPTDSAYPDIIIQSPAKQRDRPIDLYLLVQTMKKYYFIELNDLPILAAII